MEPLLATVHHLNHIVHLNLVAANNGVSHKITVILDDQAQTGILAVRDEEVLGGILEDRVVGALQLVCDVDLLAVQKQNTVGVQLANQTLASIQILGLFHSELRDTGVEFRGGSASPLSDLRLRERGRIGYRLEWHHGDGHWLALPSKCLRAKAPVQACPMRN